MTEESKRSPGKCGFKEMLPNQQSVAALLHPGHWLLCGDELMR